jgi:predicted metal-dependent phosphoesterase TrpH
VRSRVDLHVHTTASDGQLSPTETVQRALEIGLAVIAITDHDTTEGIAGALEAAIGTGLEVITGVEISTDIYRSEVHILGYYVAYRDPSLCSKLALFRDARLDRAQRMVAKLSRMGLPLEWSRVQQIAGDSAIGRPHIARAMLEQGYISSIDEAFHLYIGRNGPAYEDRYKLSPAEAVQAILAAKGLPVLAHPLQTTHLVPEWTKNGLIGLEAYYPGYTPDETRFLLDLAARYGLIATGGSDFHGGSVLPGNELGGVAVPQAVVDDLRACHERCQAKA